VKRISPALTVILLLAAATVAPSVAADATTAAALGLQSNVTFTEYAPESRTSELIRRLFSPLQSRIANDAIARSARKVSEQSIDLSQEKFAVYVPATMPAGGYGLLVFVPPWEQAAVPARWTSELDRHGMIFVTAAHSGNDTSLLDRREPLALLAAHNILQRYRVDPARVYVGGFSGGSRVALRLALGYPDLFRGALLNAGSDPIGTAQVPLPPADLMYRFQEHTRLVYLTGEKDAPRLEMDQGSRNSMTSWCVFNTKSVLVAWSGHEAPSAGAFNQGLDALELHEDVPADKLAACRKRYEQQLDDKLSEVRQLQANGKQDAANTLRVELDERFGGLAAAVNSN
jgi:hypothetical protein